MDLFVYGFVSWACSCKERISFDIAKDGKCIEKDVNHPAFCQNCGKKYTVTTTGAYVVTKGE